LIKHFEKVQARWWQHRAQFHVSVPFTRLRLTGTVLRR
jgi:hypothetical protein